MNDYLPFELLLSNPIKTAQKVGLLALLGLILGLVLPGILYYQIGTFFNDAVIDYLPDDLKKKVKTFNDETETLHNDIVNIDSRIAQEAGTLNQSATVDLLKLQRDLKAYVDSRKSPFHVVGFYPDPTIFLWSIFLYQFFLAHLYIRPAN